MTGKVMAMIIWIFELGSNGILGGVGTGVV
jgi:hypothetical protein